MSGGDLSHSDLTKINWNRTTPEAFASSLILQKHALQSDLSGPGHIFFMQKKSPMTSDFSQRVHWTTIEAHWIHLDTWNFLKFISKQWNKNAEKPKKDKNAEKQKKEDKNAEKPKKKIKMQINKKKNMNLLDGKSSQYW